MEDKRDKVFEEVFMNVNYKETEFLYGQLDELFLSLISQIEIKIPEEASTGDEWSTLEKQFDVWDDKIAQDQDGEAYVNQVKRIYGSVLNNSFWERNDNGLLEFIRPLSIWIDRMNKPHSFVQLLYYHQRMTQLKHLLEMFHGQATREAKTYRHLFEIGMKAVDVKDEQYFQIVYDENEHIQCANSSCNYIRWIKRELLDHPRIDWLRGSVIEQTALNRLYQNLKYADLAYRKRQIKGRNVEMLDPYRVHFNMFGCQNVKGRFHLQGNMNGFVGSRDSDKAIIVGFSGTEILSLKNWKTNVCQYFGRLDLVYAQAAGLVRSVWMGKSHRKDFKDSRVIVCGHSLGGGLMQYSVGAMNKDDIVGYGYNSAGLSRSNMREFWKPWSDNILHLYQPMDVVFLLPFSCQIGKSVKSRKVVVGAFRAHLLGSMRRGAGVYRREYARLR